QALFSVSVGGGALITYSAYMPRDFSLTKSAAIICIGDTLVALLAGVAIFPIVFASGLSPSGGPGLIFMTLPIAFGQMPAGHLVGTLFFFLLFFAAFSTALAMLEPMVSYLIERPGANRTRMTVLTGIATWAVGLVSVFSFNIWADVHPLGWLDMDKTLFDLIDFSVANILIPANALLLALFAGWGISRATSTEELRSSPRMYALWRFVLRYLCPIALTLVMIDLLT
ncbi:MAG: sodium-dependent transporter, partial [bacterium]|nr:sodium-dependent transporter [bacterium]